MRLAIAPAIAAESISRGELAADAFTGEVARYGTDFHGLAAAECAGLDALDPLDDWLGAPKLAVPDIWSDELPEPPSLWCLRDALVFGGRITRRAHGYHYDGQLTVTATGGVIPGSYGVMDGNRTLAGDLLTASDHGWVLKCPPEPRRLFGTYVLLGNVHRHFGHVMLEGLTRAWALEYLHPSLDVTYLVYEPEIPQFARQLLALAGVPPERTVHASPCDRVERLIVPDVGMRSHRWITTAQDRVWQRIAAHASHDTPWLSVFLSRGGQGARRCRNEHEVENRFRDAGWLIVRPEKLSVREQIRLAGTSRRLAGLVGSQMYLACFQRRGGDNRVIAPRNFFLRDDVLIAAVREHRLRVAFGSMADYRERERPWSADLDAVKSLL